MSQTGSAVLALTADRRFVAVKAGIRERVVLAVKNQGGAPLSVDLAVRGVPESWLSLQPSTFLLSAGESSAALLTFSLTQGTGHVDVPNGSYPFTVQAQAREDASLNARLELALLVGESAPLPAEPSIRPRRPAARGKTAPVVPTGMPEPPTPVAKRREEPQMVGGPLALELSPPSQIANGLAKFALWVSNRGSTPLDVDLYSQEATGSCTLEADPPSLRLSPGGEGLAKLIVRPTMALPAGAEHQEFPFTIEARAKGPDLSARAQGLLTLVPRPWWMNPLVWMGAVAGLLALIVVISLAVSAMGGEPAASSRTGALFFEDFEGRRLDRWVLGSGWQREQEGSNHFLSGEGHQWATLAEEESWVDYALRLRLRVLRGTVHLNYRYRWGPIRYLVGFSGEGLYLQKQVYSTFTPLAQVVAPHTLGQWHRVEIIGRGAQIQVLVDDRLELDFTDPSPLLAGGIAFESLDDSLVQVDDIEVIPSR